MYEEQYNNDEIDAAKYKEILSIIYEARQRSDTLEYLVNRSSYLGMINESKDNVKYFYDIDVNDYVGHMGVDIVVIILITIIGVHIFWEDATCGTYSMVRTSANGRNKIFRIRFACMMSASVFIGALYPVMEFVTKHKVFQLGDGNANVSCLESMSGSNLNISIRQFLIISIFVRVAATVSYGIIVMGITMVIKNTITVYVVSMAIVYLPYIMYEAVGAFINKISLCKGFAVYYGFRQPENVWGIHGMIFLGILYGVIGTGIVWISDRRS